MPQTQNSGQARSKRHLVVDARGIPLVVLVSGANRHDSMMFERCVDAIPGIAGLQGPARKRPAKLHADKGYDVRADAILTSSANRALTRYWSSL